jgi:predicted dehydrogenase
MDKIRWGILATGRIARVVPEAIAQMGDDTAVVTAVGSRSQASADQFGDQWQIPKRHASYEDLAHDPDVDIIYIASPHSHHDEHLKLCLNAGKHVLCEKAFTLNAEQAAECIALAQEKKLFLMEAMWTRFLPAIQHLRQLVSDGRLGQIRLVEADFCFEREYDPAHRLYNPDLGGGALLDLGIYPLAFTTMLLGLPDKVHSHAHLAPTGVDELDHMLLVYEAAGATASLACSMGLVRPREALVAGTAGYIRVHDSFHQAQTMTVALHGRVPETIHLPYSGNGYYHEVAEVHRCLRAGKLESEHMPLSETLALMQLMDSLRASWGVKYPQERNYSAYRENPKDFSF